MRQDQLNEIKEKLRDHRVPVDTDRLWENIQTRKKPERNLLWLMLLFLISIAAFSLITYLPDSSQNVIDKNKNEGQITELTSETSDYNNGKNQSSTSGNTQTIKAKFQVSKELTLHSESEGSSMPNRAPQNQKTKIYPSNDNNDIKKPTSIPPLIDSGNIQVPKERVSLEKEKILFLKNEKTLFIQKSLETAFSGVPVNIEIRKTPKTVFSLMTYGTVDYVSSSFSVPDEDYEYLQARLNSQSSKISFRTGLQLQIDLPSGVYFKSGLEYGQIRESFYYLDTVQFETTLNEVHLENNINSAGDTSRVYGPAAVTMIQNKKWDVENHYSNLDLNLISGYSFGSGRIMIYVEGGISYNLWHNFNGYILKRDGQPGRAEDYFTNKTGLAILTACGIECPVSRHLKINLGLNYKRNLSGIHTMRNPVSQKNQMLGGLLGLRYYIGRLK